MAVKTLDGVGDKSIGEWAEETDRALHIRRRLSPAEELTIGPAIDIRGTPEAKGRLHKVRQWLPHGWSE